MACSWPAPAPTQAPGSTSPVPSIRVVSSWIAYPWHRPNDVARPGRVTTAALLDVTLGGSGQAQLSQLPARDVRAVVTGSGLIRVTATASLDAAVPGDGAIIYRGNPPHLTTSITGTGAVLRG